MKRRTFTISEAEMMNKDKASNEFIENLTRKMFLGIQHMHRLERDEATAKKLQIKKENGEGKLHVSLKCCV